jgi:hypothetical protein
MLCLIVNLSQQTDGSLLKCRYIDVMIVRAMRIQKSDFRMFSIEKTPCELLVCPIQAKLVKSPNGRRMNEQFLHQVMSCTFQTNKKDKRRVLCGM